MGYRTVMPDPSPFVPKNQQIEVDGILCDAWELVLNNLNETSQLVGDYKLYTDASTGLIVRFEFLGHNTLFGGSHNDGAGPVVLWVDILETEFSQDNQ